MKKKLVFLAASVCGTRNKNKPFSLFHLQQTDAAGKTDIFGQKISNNLLPPNPSIDCQSTTDQVSTSVHWISNECRLTIDQVLIDNKLIYQQTYWLRLPIINMTRLVSDIVKSYPGFYRIQITGVFWLLPRYNPNQLFWIIPNNSHTDSNTWVERNTRLQYSDEPGRLNSRVSVSLMYSILTPV